MNTLEHPQEKSARRFWAAFILMFFLIQACIWAFAITVTAGDQSHSVVAGYDQQALTYDEFKRDKTASDGLNWKIKIKFDEPNDDFGNRRIEMRISEKENPVVGAQIKLRIFHAATAAIHQDVKFIDAEPGSYQALVRIDRPGRWCFQGTAELGAKKRLIDESIQLNKKDVAF